MSRIHEALKRAEQEQASSPRPETPPVAADLQGVATARKTPAAKLDPTEPVAETTSVLRGVETLTPELLRQRCSKASWSPDVKIMLFFHGGDHGTGTEEFRTLRSRLYKIREKQPLKSVLITSALPTEGKTFVAANLAQVISRQHERRTLLVDGDLRKSRLHVPLGAPHAPGLTEYLRGDLDEYSVIQQGPEPNLFFIPGGQPTNNPAELLSNGRFRRLLDSAATAFDWIIVDSPPALPVADASLIARIVDGVLFVVLTGFTPFDLAQKACQEFRDKHLVGAVLNRMDPHRGYGSYYYYYGYHKARSSD